uniref:HMG box domain-containing protein n=1 Tax=Heterorhabditis bacteriophora TaxID=37862 RepID=A0A1I7XLE3_HETBA
MARAKAEDKVEKPKKTRGVKKEKDPNQPKRYQSAYFLWMGENRARIKKENPGASVAEIAKIGGKEWSNVNDKSKWEKQSALDKAEYEKAMAKYKAGEVPGDSE